MGLNTWVSVVLIVGVAITAAAAIGGSFRTGRAAMAIANYRTLAESWEAKAHEAEAQKLVMAEQVADLTARVGVLQDLVTGKAQVDTLTTRVDRITALLDDRAARMDARVSEILQQIGASRADLRKLLAAAAPEGRPRG